MSEEERKLFVAGLSEEITETALRELFASAGAEIADVSIPRDRTLGKARGFAFVTLQSSSHAQPAMDGLDGSVQDGRSISVRPFRSERSTQPPPSRFDRSAPRTVQPRAVNSEDSTLYVGNLPFDATPDDVSAFFVEGGFETVKRVHLPMDPEGRVRGFGFVTLGDPEAAQAAVPAMEGKSFRGRNISVNLARRGGGTSRPGGPPASARPSPPSRQQRPAEGFRGPPPGGGGSMPPSQAPGGFRDGPPSAGEVQRRDGARREKKKDKKRKGRGMVQERGHQRRQNEGFKAPRSRGNYDDWDDD